MRSTLRGLLSYIDACSTCGYLPDPPTPKGQWWAGMVARALLSVQVGRVRVVGREHLNAPAPTIIAANHGHWIDPFLLGVLLDAPARYMAARAVFRFGGGLGALIVGPWGAFCVDLRRGKGLGAIAAAVRALTSGQTVVIFPEGWAHLDGQTGRFKAGVAHIAKDAARNLGHPICVVPVAIRYGRYPGRWIRRLPPPLQYLLVLLGCARYRRGAAVVVGAPIGSTSLPANCRAASEVLRQAIVELDPGAPRPADPAPEPIPI